MNSSIYITFIRLLLIAISICLIYATVHMTKNVIERRNCDYFGNVLEYDYFAFWTNVLEYMYDYSESTNTSTTSTSIISTSTTSTEYDYQGSPFLGVCRTICDSRLFQHFKHYNRSASCTGFNHCITNHEQMPPCSMKPNMAMPMLDIKAVWCTLLMPVMGIFELIGASMIAGYRLRQHKMLVYILLAYCINIGHF